MFPGRKGGCQPHCSLGSSLQDLTAPCYECIPILELTHAPQEEFAHGEKVCTGILGAPGRPTGWARLFEPDAFFGRFKNYLQIEVLAPSEEDFRVWDGWVHSRLRQLVMRVEQHVTVRGRPRCLRMRCCWCWAHGRICTA